MNINPEERAQKARELFEQGYNCSQAVVLAFADVLGIEPDKLEVISCGFGGGMGRMREVCGAFSGMTFLAGAVSDLAKTAEQSAATDATAATTKSPADHRARKAEVYATVQEFAAAFKAENGGSIICRELLGLSGVNADAHPQPAERTKEYYRKRPCAEIVATAAKLVAQKLLETPSAGR